MLCIGQTFNIYLSSASLALSFSTSQFRFLSPSPSCRLFRLFFSYNAQELKKKKKRPATNEGEHKKSDC